VAFAVLAWALAFKPPGVLLKIGAMAFTGIAVLTPTGLAMYYWKKATAAGALTSIILGEIYVIGFYTKLIPASWNMGFLVVVPAALLATIALIVVSLLTRPPEQERIDKYFNLFDRVFG
jgi:Na+/proline symporter